MRALFFPPNPGFAPNTAEIHAKGSFPLQAATTIAQARQQVRATSTNVGNMIHNEAVAKTFAFSVEESATVALAGLWHGQAERDPDLFARLVGENFDVVVISLANILSSSDRTEGKKGHARGLADLANMVRLCPVPVVVLGIGMQDAIPDASALSPGLWDLMQTFNDHTALFGVRGARTEAFLHQNGLTRARAFGCPSLYVYPQSIRRISAPNLRRGSKVLTAGYLDRRHLLGKNPDRIAAMERLGQQFQASYVFQNDLYTLSELEALPDLYDDSTGACDKAVLDAYFAGFGASPGMAGYHFFRDPRAWRQFAAGHEAFVGDRFHGGVVALQTGRPALFLKNDLRVSELTEHFALPTLSIADFLAGDAVALLDQALSPSALRLMHETWEARAESYFAAMAEIGFEPLTPPGRPAKGPVPAGPGLGERLKGRVGKLVGKGKRFDQLAAARQLVALRPGAPGAEALLATRLMAAGLTEEARPLVEALLAPAPDPDHLPPDVFMGLVQAARKLGLGTLADARVDQAVAEAGYRGRGVMQDWAKRHPGEVPPPKPSLVELT